MFVMEEEGGNGIVVLFILGRKFLCCVGFKFLVLCVGFLLGFWWEFYFEIRLWVGSFVVRLF